MKHFKKTFSLFLFLNVCAFSFCQAGSLGNVITISNKAASAVAADMADLLGKAIKKPVNVVESRSYGMVHLELLSAGTTKEGFTIVSNASRNVISASHINGLRNGVYYYLYELGFRFYLPGDIWTHIPELKKTGIGKTIRKYPHFANRSMFGTGGMPYHYILDKEQQVKKQWETWLQRTAYSSEEYIGGHIGEEFNKRHEEFLKKNTQFLAEFGGRREWKLSAKWCISNKAFREYFINDRIEAFREQVRKGLERNLISVDPADGGGHCECAGCSKMGTVSDRVFYLASQTAIAIKKIWPRGGVSLYAYNQHALPPKKKVEDNVYVAVIPYAYQNVAVPEILVAEWKKKAKQMGIYDYWNMTDGTRDFPRFNYFIYVPQKVAFWKRNNIKGYSLESGYSKFGAGLPLYFLSRASWQDKPDVEALFNEFCELNFGKAAQVFKVLFRRWATNFNVKNERELAVKDIEKARQLVSDPVILKRIKEIEDYLIYTILFSDAEASFGSGEAYEKIEECLKFIWSVHDQCLINTSRIHQYFLLRPVREQLPQLVDKWSLSNQSGQKEFWEKLKMNESRVSLRQLSQGRREPNADQQPAVITPGVTEENIDSFFRSNKIRFAYSDILNLVCGKTFYFSFNTYDRTSFQLNISLLKKISRDGIPGIALYDLDRNFLEYRLLKNEPGLSQQIVFKNLNKGKRYRIFVNIPEINWDLKMPNQGILADVSNMYNVQVVLSSPHSANLMLYKNTELSDLITDRFKGTVLYSQKEILDMRDKKVVEALSNNTDRIVDVRQVGTNILLIKYRNFPSLYFFTKAR